MPETTAKTKNISLENLTTFSDQMKAKYARKDAIPTAVSALTNDAKYQTEEQVTAAINAKVSSTYKAGGSAAFASLIFVPYFVIMEAAGVRLPARLALGCVSGALARAAHFFMP